MTEPQPAKPAAPSYLDRKEVIDQVQQALAEDLIAFDDLDDYFRKIFEANTPADLQKIADHLPILHNAVPASQARHLAPASHSALIGDIQIGGWIAVDDQLTANSVVGDVVIDLSSAEIGPNGVSISAKSVVGDIKLIVPEGARIQFQANSVLGDRNQSVTTPAEGGPLIRVKARSLVGDVSIYSLSLVPVGPLRRLLNVLRGAAASLE